MGINGMLFLFYRLVLAHLLTDFPFQPNWVFRLKVRYKWGVVLHGSISGVLSFILAYPFLNNPRIWTYLILLWILHIFQDRAKIVYNLQSERNTLWTFLLDELLHIGLIFLACLGSRDIMPSLSINPSWLSDLYYHDKFIAGGIFYIIATYGATIFISYAHRLIVHTETGFSVPSASEKYFGIIERALLVTVIWFGGYYLLFLPLVFVPGYYLYRKNKLDVIDYPISLGLGLVTGVILKLIV